MKNIDKEILNVADTEIVYNIFLYLLTGENAKNGDRLSDIAVNLQNMDISSLKETERLQFEKRVDIIKTACANDFTLASSVIGNITIDYNGKKGGMKACTFTDETGTVHVIFAGTGAGEWIDNGEGLSGIPEYNLYERYDDMGNLLYTASVQKDYATDQQVEALNWFNRTCGKNGWGKNTRIIVSGHSKGGNKAQFVTINDRRALMCLSFDGQGFSPEAAALFKERYGGFFEERRRKIHSFSADNDFVNVLGERLAPDNQVYFVSSSDINGSPFAYHYVETLTGADGKLNEQTEQGDISRYIQNLSDIVMAMPPTERQYVTLSIMSILQSALGGGVIPVNEDFVSTKDTVKGVIIASAPILLSMLFTKDGKDAVADIAGIYTDNIVRFIEKMKIKQGASAAAAATFFSQTAVTFLAPLLSHRLKTDVSAFLDSATVFGEKLNGVYIPLHDKTVSFFKDIAEKLKEL